MTINSSLVTTGKDTFYFDRYKYVSDFPLTPTVKPLSYAKDQLTLFLKTPFILIKRGINHHTITLFGDDLSAGIYDCISLALDIFEKIIKDNSAIIGVVLDIDLKPILFQVNERQYSTSPETPVKKSPTIDDIIDFTHNMAERKAIILFAGYFRLLDAKNIKFISFYAFHTYLNTIFNVSKEVGVIPSNDVLFLFYLDFCKLLGINDLTRATFNWWITNLPDMFLSDFDFGLKLNINVLKQLASKDMKTASGKAIITTDQKFADDSIFIPVKLSGIFSTITTYFNLSSFSKSLVWYRYYCIYKPDCDISVVRTVFIDLEAINETILINKEYIIFVGCSAGRFYVVLDQQCLTEKLTQHVIYTALELFFGTKQVEISWR